MNTSKYVDEIRAQELIDETKRRLALKVDKSSAPYTAGGSILFSELPQPSANTCGMVFNITDAFTTTNQFIDGAGIDCDAGTDVAVVKIPNTDPIQYGYNLFTGTATVKNITTEELAEMWKDAGVIDISIGGTAIESDTNIPLSSGGSAVISIDEASGTVTVSSSDTSIATVAVNGETINVTGVSAGTATITVNVASTLDNRAASKPFNVTVS